VEAKVRETKNRCLESFFVSLLEVKKIVCVYKELYIIKKGKIFNYLPFFVESPGIEPGSKQATKELSTRLFPD